MANFRPLSFNEKTAVAFVGLFVGVRFVAAMILEVGAPREDFMQVAVWSLGWGLAALIAFFVAIAGLFNRLEASVSPARSMLDRLLPMLALIAAFGVTSWLSDVRYALLQRAYADEHRAGLAGSAPKALIYWEGIPDGGVAIIHSETNPEALDALTSSDLVNGDITGCRDLERSLWSCRFG